MSESKSLPSTRTAKDLARKEPKKTIPTKIVEKVVKVKPTVDIKKLDKILKDTQVKMKRHINTSVNIAQKELNFVSKKMHPEWVTKDSQAKMIKHITTSYL